RALDITRAHNGTDVTRGDFVILDTCPAFETVVSKRINIDYAEEARDFPWRFHIKDNPFVSKK
ncbi:MAG: DNA-3-methyladenine glycosylase, partial [Clostridia bacterium]